MTTHGDIHGKSVDDAQIQAWVDEAEAGYDPPPCGVAGVPPPVTALVSSSRSGWTAPRSLP